jgi:parvulin-like peptidyl-prolyl isomerase
MGVLGPAQMPPELAEAAFSLEAGQTNEVVPSAYGFHMVGVEEQRAPRKIEFSETAAEIRRRPLGEKLQRSYAA